MIARTIHRARGLKRLVMWHGLSGALPIYLVPEYPKSGGTWFSQMLSDCLELPFPRNSTPAKIQPCILSGHHLYSPRFKNVTVVIRDGRDIMVSAYYYMLNKNEINKQFGVDHYRKHLVFDDYDDIRGNMPRFIEQLFDTHVKETFHFSWSQFIDDWLCHDVAVVKYEDLLTNAAQILVDTTHRLTGKELGIDRANEIVENYSFKKLSGRKQGQENKKSFVRKGIAGDWKNHFSVEACEAFNHYAGQQLISVGYEKDDSWVQRHAEELNNAAQVAG